MSSALAANDRAISPCQARLPRVIGSDNLCAGRGAYDDEESDDDGSDNHESDDDGSDNLCAGGGVYDDEESDDDGSGQPRVRRRRFTRSKLTLGETRAPVNLPG